MTADLRLIRYFVTVAEERNVTRAAEAWTPAVAVYLRDFDGHLLEYLAMLEHKPRPDLGLCVLVAVASRGVP